MRKLASIAAVLAALACVHVRPPEPLRAATKTGWHDDLRYFARELPRRHANAFHHISRQQFDAMVADLDRRIDSSNDDEIVTGFMAIAAAIGDGHTVVSLPANWHRLPLVIRRFGDDYRVIGASDPALVGTRVTRIGNAAMADVINRMRTIVSQDENEPLIDVWIAPRLSLPELLHGLGIVDSIERVPIDAVNDDGATRHVVVAAVARMPSNAAMTWVAKTDPISRSHEGSTFYFHYFEPEKTVYVNWRRYDNLHRFANELWSFVDHHEVRKIAVDLRQNGGGDFYVGRRNIIRPLEHRPQRVYALIGPATFSAALANAVDFRTMLHATLVGLPIGERPNSYSEHREMMLPHSHLKVGYSVRYYEFMPGNKANIVEPDVTIGITWPEYVAGKDPALDWILAQ